MLFRSDSAEIAKYLDKTYPDTPKLFPQGSGALQEAFLDGAWSSVGYPLFMNVILRTCKALNPRSEEYFRTTREALFGDKLENLGGEKQWEAMEAALAKINTWLSANGPGKDLLLMGDKVCFSDIQIAGLLVWARVLFREDSDDWKRISGWHDGKWKKLLEYFDKYAAVDNV